MTANGRQLVPWHPGLLEAEGRPVSALPRPDDAEQPRTTPNGSGRRRRDGLAFIVVALFNVAVVAVVAFSGSWQHQYELSIHLGQAHWVAGMQPLSVEGLIAAASLVIWYAARHHHGWPWAGYLVLAAGVGQTILMNLGADHPDRWPWLGPEISVWPAVAFVAAYEMAVWLVRKRQDGDDGDTTPAATRDSGGKKDGKPAVVAARRKPPRDKAAVARPGLSAEEEAARDGVSVRTVQRRRAKAATDRSRP